jgi:hypothetical protein
MEKRRRSNDPDLFDDDFNKDNEFEVQSEIDKFKFKKLFKKVKKTENQPQSIKSFGNFQDLKSTKIFVPLDSINKGNSKNPVLAGVARLTEQIEALVLGV